MPMSRFLRILPSSSMRYAPDTTDTMIWAFSIFVAATLEKTQKALTAI
jgi:hypothetical protein